MIISYKHPKLQSKSARLKNLVLSRTKFPARLGALPVLDSRAASARYEAKSAPELITKLTVLECGRVCSRGPPAASRKEKKKFSVSSSKKKSSQVAASHAIRRKTSLQK